MKESGKRALGLLLSILLLVAMLPQLRFYAAAGNTASGTCGENVQWTITETGTLLITGTGVMENYATRYGAPLVRSMGLHPVGGDRQWCYQCR